MNQNIIDLRRELHKYPELSGDEKSSTERIANFIKKCNPDETIQLGETGILFVFKGNKNGKTILFRSELDALPIKELTNVEYKSVKPDVSHACGHDGHMAILAGLAHKIANDRPTEGKVILLFQPAEETGQGAQDVLGNSDFVALDPDYVFALHNIPGYEKQRILLKKGSFASGSKGMTVRLTGKTAHAAEPQNGISPANAISYIINSLHELKDNKTLFNDFILLTIVHILLGEKSFGTSPGYAEIRLTLRAFEINDMNLLTSSCEKTVKEIAEREKLSYDISYHEIFPPTINNDQCVDIVEQSAKQLGLEVEYLRTPFKWSEDFGYFTENYNGCYFGLGSGKSQPQLHNPDFDFPDDIIESGIEIFYTIYRNTLKP